MTLDLLFITFRHTVATAAADTALTAALTYISGSKHLYTHSNIKILPWTCWLWILCLRWPYHPSSTTSCGSKWRIKGGSTSLCVKWASTAASHIDHRSRLPVTHHLTPALCPWPCVCFLYKCQWKCCCTCMSNTTCCYCAAAVACTCLYSILCNFVTMSCQNNGPTKCIYARCFLTSLVFKMCI